MKIEKIVMACLMLSALLVPVVNATPVEDEIAARIKKIGSVCVQGGDCAQATVATAVAGGGGGSSAQTHYDSACKTCHSAGVGGAPILGDKAAWEDRLAKGKDVLYQSVFNGLAPGMPARGLCFTCSDEDLKAVVDLMVAEVSQ